MGPPMRKREGNGLPLMFKKVWWNRGRGGEIEKKRELIVSERGRKEVSLRCHRMIDDGSKSVANGRKEPSWNDLVEGESARAL
ncbi:hypothetical protein TNCV_2441691 [Trichonephila clavipes]|nr:hypothetical protein TNCV_2441691 [Trichonephila clavipes]